MPDPWYRPTKDGEVPRVPWISPQATAYLESLLRPEFRVLEHGSGGSTLWFAERVAEVVSVETSKEWYDRLLEVIPNNVKLIHWRKGKRAVGFEPKKPGGFFDLMFIDGEPLDDRILYLEAARELVRPGGYVILDNANRPEYAGNRLDWIMSGPIPLERINGNTSSTKYLVTEFWQLPEESEPQHEDWAEPINTQDGA